MTKISNSNFTPVPVLFWTATNLVVAQKFASLTVDWQSIKVITRQNTLY